jgi:hypothetical protein
MNRAIIRFSFDHNRAVQAMQGTFQSRGGTSAFPSRRAPIAQNNTRSADDRASRAEGLPELVAFSEGLFEQEGLTVEWTAEAWPDRGCQGNGQASVAMLVSFARAAWARLVSADRAAARQLIADRFGGTRRRRSIFDVCGHGTEPLQQVGGNPGSIGVDIVHVTVSMDLTGDQA